MSATAKRKKTSADINHWLTLEWHKRTELDTLNTVYIAESSKGGAFYVTRAVRRDNSVFIVWADSKVEMEPSDFPGRYEAQSYAQRHENTLTEIKPS